MTSPILSCRRGKWRRTKRRLKEKIVFSFDSEKVAMVREE